jgi:serralysin
MIIDGTGASEQLVGTASDDVITGFGGNDSLRGGDGNDNYIFYGSFGRDGLLDASGEDRVTIGADYSPLSFRLVHPRFGNDLIIQQVGGDNSIELTNYFNPSASLRGSIETVRFESDGTVWNLADGTAFVIVGFTGTSAADYILATNGDDLVDGLGGNDTLAAGEGNDFYYFSGAFGVDTITDTSGSDIVIIGSDYTESSFQLVGQEFGNDLILQQINGSNSVIFSDYYGDAQKVEFIYFAATGTTWDISSGSLLINRGFFDYDGYLSANPDVRAAGIDAYFHYSTYGWLEGRDPSARFDTILYLQQNPDVAAAGLNPLQHYLSYGNAEGRATSAAIGSTINDGFDAAYYLLANPEIGLTGVDPAQHYAEYGRYEGRNPNYLFDTNFYLTNNADVAASGMNPLIHYQKFGWQQGRNPSEDFNTSAYLAANPDVAAINMDPLQHYLQWGIYEDRPLS